jgi:cyclophilin family peptidyl-prolyl cis-trans isomerase
LTLIVGLALPGCGKKTEADLSAKPDVGEATTTGTGISKAVQATPVARSVPTRDRMHQAWTDAVRNADDPPPADAVRPPDETVSKKPVHRILDAVKTSWNTIRFTTAEGKPIDYRAQIETSEGTIEIALLAEQAPNHVRNFVALAQAGYYEQLFFERIRHDQNDLKQELHLIEAGCPLGTGATGTGSIGYWLREEFTPADRMSHDEGIVGACRGEEADSAATRFYITLAKAPFLDGNYTIFGKVVAGLDVLRKIGKAPVIIDDEGVSHPEKPIVIEKVTITTNEGK